MNKSTKIKSTQTICVILILATAIYLAPRLERIELLAWGICCMSILTGSLAEAYKDIEKWKMKEENKK